MHRSTKAVRDEEKAKLSGAGKNIINQNPKERLLNFQKRKRLKELLINKFMDKYGLKQPDQTLEYEVTQFIQTEKLTDRDLQRLDAKLRGIFDSRRKQLQLKSNLTHTFLEKNKKLNLNKSQPDLLPNIQAQNTLQQNQQNNNLTDLTNTINQNAPPKKLRPSASVEVIPRQKKYIEIQKKN